MVYKEKESNTNKTCMFSAVNLGVYRFRNESAIPGMYRKWIMRHEHVRQLFLDFLLSEHQNRRLRMSEKHGTTIRKSRFTDFTVDNTLISTSRKDSEDPNLPSEQYFVWKPYPFGGAINRRHYVCKTNSESAPALLPAHDEVFPFLRAHIRKSTDRSLRPKVIFRFLVITLNSNLETNWNFPLPWRVVTDKNIPRPLGFRWKIHQYYTGNWQEHQHSKSGATLEYAAFTCHPFYRLCLFLACLPHPRRPHWRQSIGRSSSVPYL